MPGAMALRFLEGDIALNLPSQTGLCLDLFRPLTFGHVGRKSEELETAMSASAGKLLGQLRALFSAGRTGAGWTVGTKGLLWASALGRVVRVVVVC